LAHLAEYVPVGVLHTGRAGGLVDHDLLEELRGHLTRYPSLTICIAAALGEQTVVERVFGKFKEDRLAAIAALGHVMRKSSGKGAAEACHSGIARIQAIGAIGNVSP
jgi:hypothetical protein